MLTADLLDYRRRQGAVVPQLLDPAAPAAQQVAAAVLRCAQAHLGRPRGALEEALQGLDAAGLPPKAAQGLARLVLERCTFAVAAPLEPATLRRSVWDAGAAAWRGAEDPRAPLGSAPWRAQALAAAQATLAASGAVPPASGVVPGLAPETIDAALFADLEEHQRLEALEPLRAAELPYRYNVAQVQGLLLRAERVTLSAPWPEPRRLRQLLRYLKFYRLLFRQEEAAPPRGRPRAGAAAPGLTLVVDGPLSVLESATRYGLELAQFFPALLLWDSPWRLEAELRLGKRRERNRLRLEPHPWLRSHYPDHGQWIPDDVRRFVAAFNADAEQAGTPWRAAAAEALLTLPGNRSLVPDFEFRRADAPGAAPLYLERLPYPDAPQVTARLAQLAAAGRTDYLLACRAVPAVRALGERPALLAFRRSLLPGPVRAALERLRP
jgi:predicted nuclease of restriction endonuclease-like RecB superfamily